MSARFLTLPILTHPLEFFYSLFCAIVQSPAFDVLMLPSNYRFAFALFLPSCSL